MGSWASTLASSSCSSARSGVFRSCGRPCPAATDELSGDTQAGANQNVYDTYCTLLHVVRCVAFCNKPHIHIPLASLEGSTWHRIELAESACCKAPPPPPAVLLSRSRCGMRLATRKLAPRQTRMHRRLAGFFGVGGEARWIDFRAKGFLRWWCASGAHGSRDSRLRIATFLPPKLSPAPWSRPSTRRSTSAENGALPAPRARQQPPGNCPCSEDHAAGH